MKLSIEEIDLLDQYRRGVLSADQKQRVEQRLAGDMSFRTEAQKHFDLIGELKRRDERLRVRQLLEQADAQVEKPSAGSLSVGMSADQDPARNTAERGARRERRFELSFWKLTGVAAALALLCVVATFLLTQSLKNEQTANYRELRRNVEQIKRSQKLLMEDIAGQKTKPAPAPANYYGTSFLISPYGYLTTSFHVIRGADSIYVENDTFGFLKAEVVYQDDTSDIALLRIPDFYVGKNALPYNIARKESSLAEDVYTLGYPREDVVFGAGSISATTGYDGNPIAYQISVPVNPGNSGGPLFNSRGDLVGIISGQQTQSSGTAFAIKSTTLLESINGAPDSLKQQIRQARVTPGRTQQSRVDLVNDWRKYVFMVRVYKAN